VHRAADTRQERYAVGRRADLVAPYRPERLGRHVATGDVAVRARLKARVAELHEDAVDGRGEARVRKQSDHEVLLLTQAGARPSATI